MVGEQLRFSTRSAIDVAGLSEVKRQCGKDCVGKSLREAICSQWKADGVFLGKLDLSDEAMVGVTDENYR